MGAQDLYDVTLIPSLGPEEVGLPPLGPAPQAPVLGPAPAQGRSRKATAIGAALASLIGGPAAYGVPRGVLQGFTDQDRDQQGRDQQALTAYRQQAQDYDHQVRSYQQAHQSRQQQLQQAVRTIQGQAQTLKTKTEYDQAVDMYARMLQGAGFRVDGNWLRQAVPFVKPNIEHEAQALYDAWLAKPNNRTLMETTPEQANGAFVPFDRDGDGVPERVSIADLGVLARRIATDAHGRPVYAPPDAGKVSEIKANADGLLQQLIAKDVAEGKGPPDPSRIMALQQEAIRLADQAKPKAPREPREERIVQVMGPNGTPIWVRESDAVGQPAAQAARAVTGQERQALAYYNRAKQATEDIAPLEAQIAQMGLGAELRMQYGPNVVQTQTGQSYRQAQRAFTEARLRKESGAAIPIHEYENDARTYFAQPGDTAETLRQKQAARQQVLDGLKFSAGKAYEEFYGASPADVAPSPAVEVWGRDPVTGKMIKQGVP